MPLLSPWAVQYPLEVAPVLFLPAQLSPQMRPSPPRLVRLVAMAVFFLLKQASTSGELLPTALSLRVGRTVGRGMGSDSSTSPSAAAPMTVKPAAAGAPVLEVSK